MIWRWSSVISRSGLGAAHDAAIQRWVLLRRKLEMEVEKPHVDASDSCVPWGDLPLYCRRPLPSTCCALEEFIPKISGVLQCLRWRGRSSENESVGRIAMRRLCEGEFAAACDVKAADYLRRSPNDLAIASLPVVLRLDEDKLPIRVHIQFFDTNAVGMGSGGCKISD